MKKVNTPVFRPIPGSSIISIKLAGRVIVAAIGRLRMYSSIRDLLSKCPIPVRPFPAAPPEEYTRNSTFAATALSAIALPCITSCSSDTRPDGELVCTLNTRLTPCIARSIEARSNRSPTTSLIPSPARALALSLWASLTKARTVFPLAFNALATAPPCCPVAPKTRNSKDCCISVPHSNF
ncbi:Uncharacterised protein [Klebsiella pneumoniae]|nr:Uncharacterised protein [Klebsiella pneumoniae]